MYNILMKLILETFHGRLKGDAFYMVQGTLDTLGWNSVTMLVWVRIR